jgi:predicted SnoaL-like aldol condensation-catalyzing enzyme
MLKSNHDEGSPKMSKQAKSDLLKQKEMERKDIAIEYFKLISAGKYKEGLRFFAPDCKTHNPFVAGSIETLIDAMIAASKDIGAQSKEPSFAVKNVLTDGDLVAVHTELLNNKAKPNEGGLRQVHLFRFEGDKIVEYWDITQQVLPNMPNAAGAF